MLRQIACGVAPAAAAAETGFAITQEGGMAIGKCGAADAFVAEQNCPGKVNWTAGPGLRAGLALLPFLLLCLTTSSSALAGRQQSSGASLQEQNASSKEIDELRKEVHKLREDLKTLHALLESRAAGSETASVPTQPAAGVQPTVAQAAKPAPGETGV